MQTIHTFYSHVTSSESCHFIEMNRISPQNQGSHVQAWKEVSFSER